jgi:phage I-like protein
MPKLRFSSRPTLFRASIDLTSDGKAPPEFRLLAAGPNPTDRGYDLMFDDIASAMVMQAYQTDGRQRLYADWNHGMLPDEDGDGPSREEGASACSFVPEVRNGELWATSCEWTEDGRSDVESKRYNLFSPACEQWSDDIGVVRPRRLINFALVNLAGLRGIQPLLAAMADVTVTRTKESDMSPEEIKRLQDRNAELEARIAKLRPRSRARSLRWGPC